MPQDGSPTERAVEVLRRSGLRMTPQRRAIVAEIMAAQGHISPTVVARRVQDRMPGVNASTVYRTISRLEELGVLSHAHLERGPEYHFADEAGHVHLSCARCGRQDDLSAREAEQLQTLIGRHQGFRADLTHFAISGLCRDCQAALAAADSRELSRRRTPAGPTPSRARTASRGPG